MGLKLSVTFRAFLYKTFYCFRNEIRKFFHQNRRDTKLLSSFYIARTHREREGGFLRKPYVSVQGKWRSCQCVRTQCDCCNAPNHSKNTIDFLQTIFSFQHVRRSLVRRVTDAQLNSVGERCEKKGTKENCDVGFVKGRTFEVG